jgi:hypothetical protein
MIRFTSAIMVSAACALTVVVFMPGFVPQVAAHTAQSPARAATERTVACTQSWPYYEPACLHDDRQPGGHARIVRIIPIERTALTDSASR